MRLLFVCLGNICRSPIAEGLMRQKLRAAGLDWKVGSAGTESYHLGEAPHRFSQAVCRQNGLDIGAQRAHRFMPGDLSTWDHIYAMADDVLREIRDIGGPDADYSHVQLFLDDLHPGEGRPVPDPWYGDESNYPAVYALIDAGCEAILRTLGVGSSRQ